MVALPIPGTRTIKVPARSDVLNLTAGLEMDKMFFCRVIERAAQQDSVSGLLFFVCGPGHGI